AQTPFYRFTREEVKAINIASEQVYNLLVNSLDFLFSEAYKSLIPTFYGREFIEPFPEFVEYAIHTYEQNHEAIYGRFDIAYDFENGKVLKFYEGNLDTPTMYYDSVIMQD
ncbi:glutathionylspermidine synthase family protein, partial [Vibrio alginolyticus]|uniref:glutathionylspermidine synthase family protein n=1 Tax=Vibrio alginolyticus TaxID=663 RepID=UPI003D7E5832